ncbi:hypothetical protein HO133_004675 [Letharia lupina]|uniref:Uncharacterized protein n=1 Tax=Letharia lupina TaxID=560253 RepID=A0A8H6FKR9_9LECA|nr:uncharacterized protein HO133_004675 [Letharia lupina]KAF6230335.1 hypothetical protein HO133_004675 [Letharia lupina]
MLDRFLHELWLIQLPAQGQRQALERHEGDREEEETGAEKAEEAEMIRIQRGRKGISLSLRWEREGMLPVRLLKLFNGGLSTALQDRRRIQYMFSSAPLDRMPSFSEPFRTAVQNSHLSNDPEQDISTNILDAYDDGSRLRGMFGMQQVMIE